MHSHFQYLTPLGKITSLSNYTLYPHLPLIRWPFTK